MKKILTTLMLAVLVLTLAACGSQDSATGTKEDKEEKIDPIEVKSALMDFQSEMVDVLQDSHKPFTEFEAIKAKMNDPETTAENMPTKEDAEALMEEAKSAGPKAAEDIRSMEIPVELAQYEEDLKAALEDAAASYEKRVEELTLEKKETESEADQLFANFEEKLGKIFEASDLLPPNIQKELE
ncbi:hypothetical protein [Pseudalkalibacillus berkeleyi]|uniref:Lipoprotein n=1 Tax=Pseudalkalibacillus berkeleyi TaxID=1069813 RepID=A0ABS9H772_9BACL|nr:hypothetical protein [Pseudalkalibacillus berkeleyi]MCF6139628.1 hypothetical protein [Pseudalkalibacillus berkeleyi]